MSIIDRDNFSNFYKMVTENQEDLVGAIKDFSETTDPYKISTAMNDINYLFVKHGLFQIFSSNIDLEKVIPKSNIVTEFYEKTLGHSDREWGNKELEKILETANNRGYDLPYNDDNDDRFSYEEIKGINIHKAPSFDFNLRSVREANKQGAVTLIQDIMYGMGEINAIHFYRDENTNSEKIEAYDLLCEINGTIYLCYIGIYGYFLSVIVTGLDSSGKQVEIDVELDIPAVVNPVIKFLKNLNS